MSTASPESEALGSYCAARWAANSSSQGPGKRPRRALPPFDGHHIQVYIQDYSDPHDRLAQRELITEESSPYQYRFEEIVDLDTGNTLFAIEHEVRSMTHPLFARVLVNRNPAQSLRYYQMGADEWGWELPRANAPLPGMPNVTARGAALAQRRAKRMAQTRR